ncbi:PepSY domain-containing protein [Myceligenerans cantabricum]
MWGYLRPLILRLHFYAGVLIGPFLLVAAVTGLAYAFAPTLESAVYQDELRVQDTGAEPRALSEQVAAARAAHPEGSVVEVRPPASDESTTRVVLAVDGVPEGDHRTVFVDPYTTQVRGALTTSGEWLPLRAWLSETHRSLHLGDTGRIYSETAASWLWVVVLGGLAMWVAKVARTRKLRRLVVPEASAPGGRRRTLSWHGAVGTVVALALLGLSATGLTWSTYAGANIADLRAALAWETPSVDTTLGAAATDGGHDEHAGHGAAAGDSPDAALAAGIGLDGVLATARQEGLRDPVQVLPPAEEGQAWTVKEVQRSWPTQQDSIAVDGTTGAVADRVDFADYSVPAKLTRWGIDTHMGLLFGIWNQLALAAVAIGLITLVVLGYRMWWLRRPGTARGTASLPGMPRGGLRRAPLWLSVTLLGLAAVAGWFVPLFGIPLLGFLVLDMALAARARGRARRGATAGAAGGRSSD